MCLLRCVLERFEMYETTWLWVLIAFGLGKTNLVDTLISVVMEPGRHDLG